jgi:hypothetical protein
MQTERELNNLELELVELGIVNLHLKGARKGSDPRIRAEFQLRESNAATG